MIAEGDTGVLAGSWWRFDAYELVGRRIRPARGARLEPYDPWQRPAGKGKGEPPYVELGRLGEQIRDWYQGQLEVSLSRFRKTVEAPRDPTIADVRAYIEKAQAAQAGAYAEAAELPDKIAALITDWCLRYGLLGIFQQETLALSLTARPEAVLDLPEEFLEEALLARYGRYERRGSAWRELALVERSRVARGAHPRVPRRSFGELLASSAWPLDESRLPPGNVLRRALPAKPGVPAALDLAELSEVKKAYLAEDRSTGFPRPGSKAFWRAYGEDAVAFAGYAVALSEALSGLQLKTARQRAPHLERINELIGPVALELVSEKGALEARFASPSLIATLAAMAFFDVRGGVRLAHCEGCGRLFSARRVEKRFCTTSCQENAKSKRRYHADAAYGDRQRSAARERMRDLRARPS